MDGEDEEHDMNNDLGDEVQKLASSSSTSSAQSAARRKKNGSKEYRHTLQTNDDRDALPFIVTVNTPHPYTPPEKMIQEARKISIEAQGSSSSQSAARIRGRSRTRAGTNGSSSISATVSALRADGSLQCVLGEFTFDASTNCGDLLCISNKEYEVVSARSQFRYAGNRTFVLVRKVLEVKEILRIAEEASLKRLMEKELESESGARYAHHVEKTPPFSLPWCSSQPAAVNSVFHHLPCSGATSRDPQDESGS